MRITLAIRKVLTQADRWEAAIAADGKLQRALAGDTLEDVILRGLAMSYIYTKEYPLGTSIVFDITTETPEKSDGKDQV